MRKKQVKAGILSNRKENPRYYRIVLDCPSIAATAAPGQFAMLKVGESQDLLLRRPLSVHRVDGRKVEFLYEIAGKGTRMLSLYKPGGQVDLLGPLGHGFDLEAPGRSAASPILVAGGMGAAPLVFLAEALRSGKFLRPGDNITVFIGGRTKSHILCEKEFKNFGCDVKIATDDGSRGFHGRVTAFLEESGAAMRIKKPVIYACGPNPMLKEISRVSGELGIAAQVSLEAHMACGIGACLGCVVNTREGYKRVCKEGPVFDAKELIY